MKKIFLFFVFLFFVFAIYAQKIQGTIIDSLSKKPLQGAEILLLSLQDSAQQGMYADENGAFLFSLQKKGNYQIQVQFIGYAPKSQIITVASQDINLSFLLKEQALQGDSVKIVTTALEVLQKGDTTEYNANAHKLQGDATAEDLVKKMTGLTIDNEGVKTQGEAVQKVLVDGKPFFNNDPKAALSNLPAKAVQKVQIYDEQNKQNPTAEKEKTMNIVTNPNMREGTFGKVNAGYGYEDRYNLGGNINIFNGKRRVSFIGKSNNLNEQGFGFEEIGELLGGTVSRRGGEISVSGMRGTGFFDLMSGNYQDGISTTHTGGINFNDTWGKKLEVNMTYFINLKNNLQEANTTRQYLLGNEQLYLDNRNVTGQNFTHKLTSSFTYNIDSFRSIVFRPELNVDNGKSRSIAANETSVTGFLLNEANNLTNQANNGYNLANSIDYNQNFRKARRNFAVSSRFSYQNRAGTSDFFSKNIYYNDTTTTDSLNQIGETFSQNYSINGSISYAEPVGKYGTLRAQYSPSLSHRFSDKNTYNFVPIEQKYADLDSNLSNKFESDYITHAGSLQYRYEKDKLNISFKSGLQYSTLDGSQFFPFADAVYRHFFNFLPEIQLRNTFKNKAHLNVSYSTSTAAPDITQLQNVIDNRNPLILTLGNPDLKQSYTHNWHIRYRFANTEKNTSFSAGLRADYQQNGIVYTTLFVAEDTVLNENFVVKKGVQLRKPINLNGSSSINFNVNRGLPLDKIKCKVETGINGAFRLRPSLFNNVLNESYSSNIAGSFRLNSNISEKIEFSASLSPNYAWVVNSVNVSQNTAYLSINSNLSGNWIFYKQFFIGTNVTHQYYRGLSQNYNPNYMLWNMTVGTKIGKKQQWKISLFAFDLLNQNRNIGRTTADAYIEDKQTNVLSQYFMLNLAYNFNRFKEKK